MLGKFPRAGRVTSTTGRWWLVAGALLLQPRRMTAPMAQPRPASWRELMDQQDLVLSRVQALGSGLSEDAWQWLVETGRWQRVLPGVAVGHSGEITARQRAWAAVLHAGSGAALTADAALVEHGMRVPRPAVVHVAIPHERKVRRQLLATGDADELLQPHRLRSLGLWRHPARQPPVLRVAPAALHAAAWAASDRAAEWRLAAVVQQRLVRADDLRSALGQMQRLPRRPLVAEVLDDIEFGAHAGSELDFLRFLRHHQLPLPDRLQRPIRSGKLRYLDAWWERQRVIAEIDGAHHRSVGIWDDDALRANGIVIEERHDRVLLLRFTRGNLRHDGLEVSGQLRAALT